MFNDSRWYFINGKSQFCQLKDLHVKQLDILNVKLIKLKSLPVNILTCLLVMDIITKMFLKICLFIISYYKIPIRMLQELYKIE